MILLPPAKYLLDQVVLTQQLFSCIKNDIVASSEILVGSSSINPTNILVYKNDIVASSKILVGSSSINPTIIFLYYYGIYRFFYTVN